MKNVFTRTIVVLLIALFLVPGVLLAQGARETAGERHAFIFKSTGNPFGERLMDGFREGIEEQGHQAILRAPDLPTAEAQIQIVEQLIAQNVDSISLAANDYDALEPVLRNARNAGIPVLTADSNTNPASRSVFINQADSEMIGRTLIQAAYDMIGGSGQIAILSATSQAANQNLWIEWMQEELKESRYDDMELVRIAYGDDLRDKSVAETEALLRSYPDLKCIIAPTTVGIAAASLVVTDNDLIGDVFITGLGLPSEMAEYIHNGACPYMFLWNPIDLGYLTAFAAGAVSSGAMTGAVGDTFDAGRLGSFEVVQAADGGTEVLLGSPFKFDADNIDDWKTVY